MVKAVVFQLAVEPGLATEAGAASWGALSRQLPRLLVQALNGDSDRGVRFFPFIGSEEGRRGFLHVPEPFPVATLEGLHQQPGTRFLVDGILTQGTWRLRIVETSTGRAVFDEELPFDPFDPLPTAERCLFELTGALGIGAGGTQRAAMALPCPPSGPAVAPFLMGRDDLLTVEANLLTPDCDALVTHTREAVSLGMGDPYVRDHCIELSALLVRHGGFKEAVGDLLGEACERLPNDDGEFLYAAGAVFEVCQRPAAALCAYERAAAAGHDKGAARAVTLASAEGELQRARTLCEARIARGATRDQELIGQLSAIADRLGDHVTRDSLCEELLAMQPLSPAVARIVLAYLTGAGRAKEAVALGEATLKVHSPDAGLPGTAGMLLELGRARLLHGHIQDAEQTLQRCVAAEADEETEADARRLIRFAATPELVREMMAVENALAQGEVRLARRLARRAVRVHRRAGESWLTLGMVEQRRGKQRRAMRAYRQALQRDGQLADAHNRLGILLVARGKADEGYQHLAEAVRATPREASCRLHMAQACKILGREGEGRNHLDAAERLGADPSKVREVRQQFFSDVG